MEDAVCLNDDEEGDLCVENFEFLALTEASGLEGMDGILGMSPTDDAPSYMQTLYNAGKIDEEAVTFWINKEAHDSVVTLGGVVPDSVRGEYFSLPIVKKFDNWWTVGVSDVQYGDSSIKNSTINYAILDTGTSLIYIGESEYREFTARL